eukprot:GHUV01037625.1.p1 GENE.GHUV01037625.1~~GHUV01037625.1.p1  ORF type:complete len:151 (+),score=13.87 GHUV01037625.1:436-888(+)
MHIMYHDSQICKAYRVLAAHFSSYFCSYSLCIRSLCDVQATMIVADATTCLEVSGRGELLEPADGVHAIGSGARFAIAAARALMPLPELGPLEVAQRAMKIAAEKCIYTNTNFIWERIDSSGQLHGSSSSGVSSGPSVAGVSSGGAQVTA